MTHSLKILETSTGYSQVSDSPFINVEVEVFDGEESLGTRNFGYALGTSKEDILADLTKVRMSLDSDKETAAASAELQKGLDDADKLKELKDTTI